MLAWDEALRSYVEGVLLRSAVDSKYAPNVAGLFEFEQSIEFLLDPAFLRRYLELLRHRDRIQKGGFLATDPDAGADLFKDLKVIGVTPERAFDSSEGSPPPPPLPLPVFHWRSHKGRPKAPARPQNLHLVIDSMRELKWHPQYLLMCSECSAFQGWPSSAETYRKPFPHPTDQLRTIAHRAWTHSRGRSGHRQGVLFLDRLKESFGEEVWGFGVSRLSPAPELRRERRPTSGRIAELLDQIAGFNPIPADWPHPELTRYWRRRDARYLAWTLRQLQCQICEVKGFLRFMPRVLMPIDVDLAPDLQGRKAKGLATILRTARAACRAEGLANQILWFPADLPRIRLVHIARRLELRHEDRSRGDPDRPENVWLVAMWLVTVAQRSKGKKPKKGDDWDSLFRKLGLPKEPPGPGPTDRDVRALRQEMLRSQVRGETGLNTTSVSRRDSESAEQAWRVRNVLSEAVAADKPSAFAVGLAHKLLSAEDLTAACARFAEFYQSDVLRQDLEEYRSRKRPR